MRTIITIAVAVVAVKAAKEFVNFVVTDGGSTDSWQVRKFAERTQRQLNKLSEDQRERILDGPLRPSHGDFMLR